VSTLVESISVSGIRVWGKHGADPGEQQVAQPIDLAFTLRGDIHQSAHSDALDDTVSYFAIHAAAVAVVRDRSFALLEALGSAVLDAIFADHRISFASVTLAKPGKLDGATPSVTVTRSRA